MLELNLSVERQGFTLTAQCSLPLTGIVGIVGRTGSGKTTLFRAIAGLEQFKGSIKFNDEWLQQDERGIFIPPYLRNIATVFQESCLFPHLSVEQNLCYGQKRAKRHQRYQPDWVDYQTVLGLLQLEPLLSRKPDQLSGGEKQRVALGRALLSQPRLLLMDEPLANLDQHSRNILLPVIATLPAQLKLPMLYISHEVEEIKRIASHVLTVTEGEANHCQTLEAFLTTHEHSSFIKADYIACDETASIGQFRYGEQVLYAELPPSFSSASFSSKRPPIRLYVHPDDVMLAVKPVSGLSTLNQLEGVIEACDCQTNSAYYTCKIKLQDDQRLIANLPKKAYHDLKFSIGQIVTAIFKAKVISSKLHI